MITVQFPVASRSRFGLPYPAYRDVKVEWFASVPQHWGVAYLRHVCRFVYGDSLPNEARQPGPFIVFGSNGPVGTHTKANTLAPAILVGRKGSFGKVNYSESPCFAIDTTYFVDRSSSTADLRWVYYTLQLLRLDVHSDDSAIPGLSRETAYRNSVPVPPLPEQRAIAAFLDRETARIDALIAKKEQLIALLREKRAALISHAVTRGLDPDAPLKDSGVPWLGEIPAHWKAVQLKRRWSVIDCKHRTAEYVADGIPIVSTTEIKPGRLDLTNSRQTSEVEYLDLADGIRMPRRGDIIYSRNASVGSAAFVDTDIRFCMGQDVCLIRSTGEDQLFLSYLLDSSPLRQQLESLLVGATIRRINVEQIRQFWVACPPLTEQRSIAVYLDSRTDQIDQIIAKVREHIGVLREHRTALISAAVTGQIDVRGEVEVGE